VRITLVNTTAPFAMASQRSNSQTVQQSLLPGPGSV